MAFSFTKSLGPALRNCCFSLECLFSVDALLTAQFPLCRTSPRFRQQQNRLADHYSHHERMLMRIVSWWCFTIKMLLGRGIWSLFPSIFIFGLIVDKLEFITTYHYNRASKFKAGLSWELFVYSKKSFGEKGNQAGFSTVWLMINFFLFLFFKDERPVFILVLIDLLDQEVERVMLRGNGNKTKLCYFMWQVWWDEQQILVSTMSISSCNYSTMHIVSNQVFPALIPDWS